MRNIALYLVATLLLLGLSCRPWGRKSPEERMDWLAKRLSKELELNDTQKETLHKIKAEFIARHREEKPRQEEDINALAELVRQETIDQAKLKELRRRHQARRVAMEDFFIEKALELHKILTPQQRAKAAELILNHWKKMHSAKH
ncbi:MAG: periplasmic heavy metal sensor [Turneriella sp.]|nr:periplasmic heavy metal sensor [Leptospiraceae bacterium]MCX7632543.1 periplasmic heavy metal sensor [Turneriella sp.]